MVLLQEDLETFEKFGPLVTYDLDEIIALDERARKIVEVADSQIQGSGYRALRDITEEELVLSAYGAVIGHQTGQHSIQHNMDVHVQPFAYGGKYLNHSCNGNLVVHSDKRGMANFFARRLIKKGEEVAYYYAMTEFE
ncbi:SET domain-containing protein-lysine N-methyltransferase [Candidatus Woesearchaeota archaeon]|nr:SET domain-containing protein-lysine N-methyltransferase [Candidatus Woesearchaeota archaeon]